MSLGKRLSVLILAPIFLLASLFSVVTAQVPVSASGSISVASNSSYHGKDLRNVTFYGPNNTLVARITEAKSIDITITDKEDGTFSLSVVPHSPESTEFTAFLRGTFTFTFSSLFNGGGTVSVNESAFIAGRLDRPFTEPDARIVAFTQTIWGDSFEVPGIGVQSGEWVAVLDPEVPCGVAWNLSNGTYIARLGLLIYFPCIRVDDGTPLGGPLPFNETVTGTFTVISVIGPTLEERLASLEAKVEVEMDAINDRLDVMSDDIESLKGRLSTMSDEVKATKVTVNELLDDIEALRALSDVVNGIKNQAGTLGSQLDSLSSDIATLRSEVATLKNYIYVAILMALISIGLSTASMVRKKP